MKKKAYELNREFSKKEVQTASKYVKKYSKSLVVKEMANQNNPQISFHPC
jgi:hypothetical protein